MRRPSPSDRSLWLLLPLCGAYFIYWAFYLLGHLPTATDLFLVTYPLESVTLRSFEKGLIPLWDPWIGCGTPHLSLWFTSCLYPLHWLYRWTGSAQGMLSVNILHGVIAFLGFYQWARVQGLARSIAIASAFASAGSALFVSCWAFQGHVAALAWIPWIFWAADRSLKKEKSLYPFLFTLFLSLQLLAGYPIYAAYTWLVLGMWLLRERPSLGEWRTLCLCGAGALALTAAQWLPFMEFWSNALRGGWWKTFPYFDNAADYGTLLWPNALGEPGQADYQGQVANYTNNLYLGVIPVLCLGGTLLLAAFRKKGLIFWCILSWGLLFWMAGSNFLPLHLLPEKVLEAMEPSRAVGLFVFAASTLAGAFLEDLRSSLSARWLWVLPLLLSLWIADIGLVPWRLLHTAPNIFNDPRVIQAATALKTIAQGKRIISLERRDQMGFAGSDRFEKVVTDPASRFIVNSNAFFELPSTNFYLSCWLPSAENLQRYVLKGFPYQGDLLRIAGVSLVLLPERLPNPRYQVKGNWGDSFANVDGGASERFRFVPEETTGANAVEILNRLTGPNSGWEKKVYLEKDPKGDLLALAPASRVRSVDKPRMDDVNCFSALCNAPQAGYGVFNETFTPGWHAWVDGKPASILRAYGLFMAVPVEKGTHQVDWRYEPAAFRLGAFLSLLGLAGGLLLFTRRRFDEAARL